MKCKFLQRDLEQRLNNTFCRYADEPVFVRYHERSKLALYDVSDPDRQLTVIDSKDDLFDVSTPPLGYCQITPNKVVYITRLPHRRYKQSIDTDSVTWEGLPKSKVDGRINFFSKAFYNTMKEEYPSLSQALEAIRKNKNYTEVAMSNSCALQYDSNLQTVTVFFKNEAVGWISPKDLTSYRPKVIVPNSAKGWVISSYLREFTWEVE